MSEFDFSILTLLKSDSECWELWRKQVKPSYKDTAIKFLSYLLRISDMSA